VQETRKSSAASGEEGRFASVLVETGRLLASTLDLDQVLRRILASLKRVIEYDSVSVMILKGENLVMQAVAGFSESEKLEGLDFPIAKYRLNARIIATGTPVVLDDVRASPEWIGDQPSPEVPRIRGWMGIPLVADGRVLGVLCVDSYRVGAYGQPDLSRATAFASQAAMAIRNARLYGEADRRIRQLSVLNRVGQALTGQMDENKLCFTVGELVREIFSSGIVYIAVVDESRQMIETPYFLLDGKTVEFPPLKMGQGLTSVVLRRRETLLVQRNALEILTDLGGIMRKDRPPRSWLGVPIMRNETAFGVLSVQDFDNEDRYDADDVSLLETIASNIAGALDNARAYREASRRADETRALLEVARDVSSSLELDAVLGTIVDRARALLTRDTVAVYLMDDKEERLAVVAITGVSAGDMANDTVDVGQGIIGTVARTGSPEIVDDTMTDERAVHVEGSGEDESGEKLMAAPLAVRDRVLGVMAIWRGPDEPTFTKHDLDFCAALARHAALALSNAQIYRQAQKAREEAEEASRVKSRFLATMSHELRTPLNSVINFAYLLMEGVEGPVNASQRELLVRIEASGKHLLELINDVLDLSKIESGRMELFLEPMSAADVIADAVSFAQGLVRGKPVRLEADVADGMPPVRADRTRIRQVVLNLLSNAAKFTESGTIAVKSWCDGAGVHVDVTDTGIGMRPEDIGKAFQEFVQLDSGTTRRAGGTGLGLPIAKRFIEMHGGAMHAESEPGRGTTVGFVLPALPIPAAAEPGGTAEPLPPGEEAPGDKPAAKGTVLIIADDPDRLERTSSALASGWRTIKLADSRMAVETARKTQPDLLILDVMMPHRDGWDVLRSVKGDPATRGIPVVMCSMLRERNLALSLSADDYLEKPIQRDALRDAVSRFAPAGGTVLAVDDDGDALEIVRMSLAGAEWRVAKADDAEEGLERARSMRPDVIVLDLSMRNADAFGEISRLRSLTETAGTPIIALSGTVAAACGDGAPYPCTVTDDDGLVDAVRRAMAGDCERSDHGP